MEKKIGLYFGSFNPITNAHLMVAIQALEYSDQFSLDEVWLVVSPQNPQKKSNSLAPAKDRVNMIKEAIKETGDARLKCCEIELGLPTPSYTHVTLHELELENPGVDFTIICGADTYHNVPTWKHGEFIWNKYSFLVIERKGDYDKKGFTLKDSDDFIPGYFSVSATLVRERIKNNLDITPLVPSQVKEYLYLNKVYHEPFDIRMAVEKDAEIYAKEISALIEDSAKKRGVGIAKRSPEYISEKIKKGQAIIALDEDGTLAGFCYIESWQGKKYVANSGLIIPEAYRNMGLSRLIKKQAFDLSRKLFPESKLFSITTNGAVMKINNELGYRPVPFKDLTSDDEFWSGCSTCPHYETLTKNNKTFCLCTGLLYEPE